MEKEDVQTGMIILDVKVGWDWECPIKCYEQILLIKYVKRQICHTIGKNMTQSTQYSNSFQQDSTAHYFAELVLIQTALIAISVTLAAYCCKVVNCCSPGQRMVSQCRNGTSRIRNGLAIGQFWQMPDGSIGQWASLNWGFITELSWFFLWWEQKGKENDPVSCKCSG